MGALDKLIVSMLIVSCILSQKKKKEKRKKDGCCFCDIIWFAAKVYWSVFRSDGLFDGLWLGTDFLGLHTMYLMRRNCCQQE